MLARSLAPGLHFLSGQEDKAPLVTCDAHLYAVGFDSLPPTARPLPHSA